MHRNGPAFVSGEAKASDVAAGTPRTATRRELSGQKPNPIASGVIEESCRSLINDRLDLTGTRCSVTGAKAVLRMRVILGSGDWEEYRAFHTQAAYVVNHLQF